MGKRIIAVAVGVLVAVALGVGGVLVASRSSQRTPATLPALDVSGSGDQAATSAQAAPGRSRSVDGNAESGISPSGRVQYQVRGTLPDLPRFARARVAALAGKLGLSGQPARSGRTWTVVDGARRLFVNQVAGGPWTFSAGRFVCGAPVGGIGPVGGIAPRVDGCPAPPRRRTRLRRRRRPRGCNRRARRRCPTAPALSASPATSSVAWRRP